MLGAGVQRTELGRELEWMLLGEGGQVFGSEVAIVTNPSDYGSDSVTHYQHHHLGR